jgi:oligopeptide transport system substrate-binding protein
MSRKILYLTIMIFLISCSSQPAPTVETANSSVANTSEPQTTQAPTLALTLTPFQAMPGKEVIPISKMAREIPWLPYNKASVPITTFIGLNVSVPPFDNVLVRKAFSMAVDRQRIVNENKTRGTTTSVPATTFVPAEVLGRDLYQVIGFDFDLKTAKQLMAEAGYAKPSSIPKINFVFYEGTLDLAKAYQDMWKTAFGIEVQLVPVKNANELYNSIDNNKPGLFIPGSWVADNIDPHNFLYGEFISKDSHYPNFNDQQYVDLINQAQQKAAQPLERQQLYIQAEKILCEDGVYVIPVTHFTTVIK